jgi:hypothetical protein
MQNHKHVNNMSSEALTRLQVTIVIVVIVGATVVGVSVWWITKPKPCPPFDLTENAVEMGIRVEAEGVLLRYEEELFWSEDQFSEIMENQDEFSSNLIGNFSESLSIYGERNEHAVDTNIEFNQTRKSTILKCDIQGAMISSDYFTFRWLLNPLGLDFIDDNFQESEKSLFWEGLIDGIPTTITISFAFPIAHCHAHVWRK